MSRKAANERGAKPAPKWRAYEELLAMIQRKLAPDARVTESDRIIGQSGIERKIDVTLRQKVGSYEILVIIDCKRHRRKVGPNYVGGVAEQASDVRADVAVLVSHVGFTDLARSAARRLGIKLQTLREAESADWSALAKHAVMRMHAIKVDDPSASVLTASNNRLPVSFETHTLDADGKPCETIGQLFLEIWKAAGPERQIGQATLDLQAAPGQVYIRDGERLEEVARFALTATLRAKCWVVPLRLAQGHVLTDEGGTTPAYQELMSESFDWQGIMAAEPGTDLTPEEFGRMLKEDGAQSIDLSGAKKFLRLVIEAKR